MVSGSSVARFFRLVWAQVLLALLGGLALSLFPETLPFAPLHHIGVGLVVAAFVTVFWHLREFAEYFAKFAEAVLVRHDYLERLKPTALTELRSNAARAMLGSEVDNPDYEQHALADWMDSILYKWLPTARPLSGIYREHYREKLSLEFVTLETALKTVGVDTTNVPAAQLGSYVLRLTTTTWYTVVSPKLKQSDYIVPFGGKGAEMPHFPISQRIAVRVGHSERDAEDVPVTISDIPLGGVQFEVSNPKQLEFSDGRCPVWLRSVEYRSPERELHLISAMSTITNGITIDAFQIGGGPTLSFDGDIIAPGIHRTPPEHAERSVSLHHGDWLFERNGYVIWWWPK